MKIFVVYQDYENENTPVTNVKFYTDKEQAIQEFNILKNEYLYNENWKISDMFDSEDVTDLDNSIMFIHKISQTVMYINIETVIVEHNYNMHSVGRWFSEETKRSRKRELDKDRGI